VPWQTYAAFLAAVVLILVPGPDFAVVAKNTLAAGRWRVAWTGVGVASSDAVQGIAAAVGLGAVIVRSVTRWPGGQGFVSNITNRRS